MLCAKCVMEKDRTFGICWTYCSYDNREGSDFYGSGSKQHMIAVFQ